MSTPVGRPTPTARGATGCGSVHVGAALRPPESSVRGGAACKFLPAARVRVCRVRGAVRSDQGPSLSERAGRRADRCRGGACVYLPSRSGGLFGARAGRRRHDTAPGHLGDQKDRLKRNQDVPGEWCVIDTVAKSRLEPMLPWAVSPPTSLASRLGWYVHRPAAPRTVHLPGPDLAPPSPPRPGRITITAH